MDIKHNPFNVRQFVVFCIGKQKKNRKKRCAKNKQCNGTAPLFAYNGQLVRDYNQNSREWARTHCFWCVFLFVASDSFLFISQSRSPRAGAPRVLTDAFSSNRRYATNHFCRRHPPWLPYLQLIRAKEDPLRRIKGEPMGPEPARIKPSEMVRIFVCFSFFCM